MKGLFLDASDELAEVYHAVVRSGDPSVTLNMHGAGAGGSFAGSAERAMTLR